MQTSLASLLPQLHLLNVDPEDLVYGDSHDVAEGRIAAIRAHLEGYGLLEPESIPLENWPHFLVVQQCN